MNNIIVELGCHYTFASLATLMFLWSFGYLVVFHDRGERRPLVALRKVGQQALKAATLFPFLLLFACLLGGNVAAELARCNWIAFGVAGFLGILITFADELLAIAAGVRDWIERLVSR